MKFAQYLNDTQTPEWKKAYIDYRGLKKRITAIRKAQQGLNFHVLASDDSPDEAESIPAAPRPSDANSDSARHSQDDVRFSKESARSIRSEDGLRHERSSSILPAEKDRKPSVRGRAASFALSSLKVTRGKSFSSKMNGTGSNTQRHPNPLAALPLHELLTQLSPVEVSFFTMLDAQLDKVESFYLAREKEMLSRGHTLQIQLNELNDHRKLFLEAQQAVPWTGNLAAKIRDRIGLYPPRTQEPTKPETAPEARSTKTKEAGNGAAVLEYNYAHSSALERISTAKSNGKQRYQEEEDGQGHSDDTEGTEHQARLWPYNIPLSADPDSYLYAKRKLKKAVSEHYRGLEVLHNYRVLNITGFRKALKKFEKVTKIPVQQQYMTEKIEKSAFTSDKAVRAMMDQMEDMYAVAFARGDKKRATRRLRAGNSTKSHHFSTFRSGIFLGLAIPAFVDGLVKVFQQQTRDAFPKWDVLLYVYSLILIPVLFSLLVGFNLLVWANSRINYVFIFELEILTQLDHREYFEIPSLLLAALSYAFWLSFSLIGAPSVSPSIWPLVWMAFTFSVVFDPFPVLFRSSRYWLLKNVGSLFVSGTKRVEFTDFWMGDQFCSLVFTISNLYFLVCVYVVDFSSDWNKCSVSGQKWPVAFVLASLPLLIRLIQSVKRYVDSKLITHLINGGKYGSGVIAYLFYFMWRHNQINHGTVFAFYCLFNVLYSLYALSWDLLMDWSILQLHSKYFLLRPELVYTNYTPMYYFAIISNTVIRFIWVIYIPKSGPSMMVRTFIAGFLEMLRRWQWNFYRLENEHLGNMDQYRVTREVPLPYVVDDRNRDYDRDDDDDHLKARR